MENNENTSEMLPSSQFAQKSETVEPVEQIETAEPIETAETAETVENIEPAEEKKPTKKKRDLSVVSQYRGEIFGLSILSIVIFHFCEAVLLTRNPAADYARDFANVYNWILSSSGVEVFLFLSGMGLFFSMKKNGDVLRFYAKRFRRVLIPYLIFGLVYWVINDFFIYHTDFLQFLNDYLLISLWTQGVRRFWFIGFILILYVVFPLFFRLLDTTVKHRGLVFALLLAVNIAACSLTQWLAPDVYSNIELAICRLPAFLFGIYYGGKIYNKEKFGLPEKILVPLGLLLRLVTYLNRSDALPILFMDTPYHPFFRHLHTQVGFYRMFLNTRYETCLFALSMLFVTALLLDLLHCKPLGKVLATVGTYSFELYITHVAVRNMMHALGFPTYIWWNYVICMAISALLTVGLHKLTDLIFSARSSAGTKPAAQ